MQRDEIRRTNICRREIREKEKIPRDHRNQREIRRAGVAGEANTNARKTLSLRTIKLVSS